MKIFKIIVKQTIVKEVEVSAENSVLALDDAKGMLADGEIIFDDCSIASFEFNVAIESRIVEFNDYMGRIDFEIELDKLGYEFENSGDAGDSIVIYDIDDAIYLIPDFESRLNEIANKCNIEIIISENN